MTILSAADADNFTGHRHRCLKCRRWFECHKSGTDRHCPRFCLGCETHEQVDFRTRRHTSVLSTQRGSLPSPTGYGASSLVIGETNVRRQRPLLLVGAAVGFSSLI
jgi:hypothetical protein